MGTGRTTGQTNGWVHNMGFVWSPQWDSWRGNWVWSDGDTTTTQTHKQQNNKTNETTWVWGPLCHSGGKKLNDKIKFISANRAQQKRVLLAMSYWEDMRALVMPRWLCGYTVMLTSLRESFMGGGGGVGMARSGRKRQKKFNIRKPSQQIVCMKTLWCFAKLHH